MRCGNILLLSAGAAADSAWEEQISGFVKRTVSDSAAVEHVMLEQREVRPCAACMECLKTGKCVIDDDGVWIAEQLEAADELVLAVKAGDPAMCRRMKTILDRMAPVCASDYRFRKVRVLIKEAEGDLQTTKLQQSILTWAGYFGKAESEITIER